MYFVAPTSITLASFATLNSHISDIHSELLYKRLPTLSEIPVSLVKPAQCLISFS